MTLAGKPKATFPLVGATPEARAIIEELVPAERIADAIFGKEKAQRSLAIKMLKEEAKVALAARLGEGKFSDVDLNVVFEDLQYKAYRKTVLERGVRADGRDAKSVRPLQAQVGVFPRVHGSAIFQRGDTQNIAITTLGPTKEAQEMDGLTGGATSKSFILHYNFPPFSVGETGRTTGPGRREIGHGALAERSLVPCSRPRMHFPYRSACLAKSWHRTARPRWPSICGGCLALMDAGVPIIVRSPAFVSAS